MSKALTGKRKAIAEAFYDKLLATLLRKKLPFMIGGTYAFNHYTGLNRETGDIDIAIPQEDYPNVLKSLTKSGYMPKLADSERIWLAKVYDENGSYTDLIFGGRNGLYNVEREWLKRSNEGVVLGHKVLLEPVEEMIRSKCYVHNRHRNDSGDVVHLILKQGKNINWEHLLLEMNPHWELLMVHILLFLFIYPSEREIIPKWLIERLVVKLEDRISHPPTKDKITRGFLLSQDYEVGVSNWGYKPVTDMK